MHRELQRNRGTEWFAGNGLPRVAKLLFALPILTGLAVQACDDGVTRLEGELGGIEVTTLTESPSTLPDSFTVLLNGAVAGKVGRSDVYVIPFLPPGDYLVELADEWEGCWLGANLRPLTVEAKEDVPTTFLVRCEGEPRKLPGAGAS